MEIRKATKEDIDLILKNRMEFLKNISNIEPTSELEESTYNFMCKHVDDGAFVAWLAMDDNRIASIVVMCVYELLPTKSNRSEKTGYLLNVFTHEDYRRRGLATELLNRLIADAKSMGIGLIHLHATDEGKFVYDKLGFDELSMEMALKI